MIFEPTEVDGAFLVQPERLADERGFFARTFSVAEFTDRGLNPQVVQRSVSWNRLRGTLRGMHFQTAPHQETKLVSCIRGEIYDVIIDLRPDSPSHRRWIAATLTADNGHSLYIPKGCAHGFITLTDDALVDYQIGHAYHPEAAGGVRYDDPAFGVKWPMEPTVINARDREYARYEG
jgi:dTDP-4-dehydrorhamnose 3,5-epimerase